VVEFAAHYGLFGTAVSPSRHPATPAVYPLDDGRGAQATGARIAERGATRRDRAIGDIARRARARRAPGVGVTAQAISGDPVIAADRRRAGAMHDSPRVAAMEAFGRRRDGVRTWDNGAHQEDVDRAMANAAARLRRSGVELTGEETSQQLVRLLTAVEEFERAVERQGGDTFLDAPGTRDPENVAWVIPDRRADERLEMYIHRIERATERIEGGEG
jgi:hypothetical protein